MTNELKALTIRVTYLASVLSGEFAEEELPMSAECYKAALYVVANALVDCMTLGRAEESLASEMERGTARVVATKPSRKLCKRL